MADVVYVGEQAFTLGETRQVAIQLERADYSSFTPGGPSAGLPTVTFRDSTGVVALGPVACWVTTGVHPEAGYIWTPAAAGSFEALFIVVDQGETLYFKVSTPVNPVWP
jgi:hypothetical protein